MGGSGMPIPILKITSERTLLKRHAVELEFLPISQRSLLCIVHFPFSVSRYFSIAIDLLYTFRPSSTGHSMVVVQRDQPFLLRPEHECSNRAELDWRIDKVIAGLGWSV